ncbi:MAG TPA: hypothetical protein VIF62_34200 [Labilithrix sp.]|jgi:hypothetical protein
MTEREGSPDSGELHVDIMKRARRLNRRLTATVIVLSTVAGFASVAWFFRHAWIGGGVVGAKAFGGAAATTLIVSFGVTAIVTWFIGRRVLLARLRAWIDEAARSGVDRASFDYVVAMYAKGSRKEDNWDVLPPRK